MIWQLNTPRAEITRSGDMAFTKITNAELNSRGATTLPNQPAISPQALKEEFDAPAKKVVAPKFNNLIDELEASTAAASIGASAPTGLIGDTVQLLIEALATAITTIKAQQVGATAPTGQTGDNVQALINSLAEQVSLLNSAKHTHSNKTLLDSYDQTNTNIADAVSQKHSHSNKSLLDNYTQTETDLADAVTKKHSHSNKSVLDKLTENSSGHLVYDNETDGFQPFINQEITTPTHTGKGGDLLLEGNDGTTDKKLWRYENGSWTRTMLGHKIIVSTTDIGEGAALGADEIYIVVES